MCNAAKHSPGCSCGFGPPYPTYVIGKVTEWAEEALDNPELVQRSLRQLAWDEPSIQTVVGRYSEIAHSSLPRSNRIEQIRELLGMRQKLKGKETYENVNVPLYRFGAPSVHGAKVEYSEGEKVTKASGWNVKFFGIGAANTTSFEVSRSRTFIASSGEYKLVYVPVRVRITEVAILDCGKIVGHGHEAEVVSPEASGDPHLQKRGCITLPKNMTIEKPTDSYDMVDLALSGDRSRDIHRDKRSWETDVAHELSLQLSNINVSALVRVKRTRRLELAFELPAGHDYRAYLAPGFTWWELPLTG